jgi:hypothetical protein
MYVKKDDRRIIAFRGNVIGGRHGTLKMLEVFAEPLIWYLALFAQIFRNNYPVVEVRDLEEVTFTTFALEIFQVWSRRWGNLLTSQPARRNYIP